MYYKSRLILLLCTLFFIAASMFNITQSELIGPNICTDKVRVETFKLERYERPFLYKTFDRCINSTQGFKCARSKIGFKLSFRKVSALELKMVVRCCKGYVEMNSRYCVGKRVRNLLAEPDELLHRSFRWTYGFYTTHGRKCGQLVQAIQSTLLISSLVETVHKHIL